MVKKIILKNLTIKNFKGIKDLTIDFSENTNIYGKNGSGKTTIFDAFNFLLFDKDSEDRTKFEIQPLDSSNNKIHHIETQVEGVLLVDNQDVVLRKIYKEKWVKPKGKSESQLRGNETLYYLNDVPQKQKDYKEYISGLVDEKLFKLVTNPLYFCSLDWKKRREILMNITGDIGDLEVIKNNSKLKPIEEYLNKDKKIDDAIKEIKGKIKRLKDDREQIPARIDELVNSINEEINFNDLKEKKKDIEKEIDFIDSEIIDKSKYLETLVSKKEEYFNFKNEYNEKLALAKEELSKNDKGVQIYKKISNLENNITVTKAQINNQQCKLNMIEKNIARNNENLQILRDEYNSIKKRKFEINENEFVCPTCHRKFEDTDIDEKKKEIQDNFNSKKANDTKNNIKAGTQLKQETDRLKEETKIIKENIDKENIKIHDDNEEIKALRKELELEKETLQEEIIFEGKEDLVNRINTLEEEINNFQQEDTSVLKENKNKLQSELKSLNQQLAMQEINVKTKKRIEELEQKERDLSIQIAQLEQQEILCQDFIKSKVNLLESKVNSMFKYVRFRFVKEYNSGGIEEDCEPIVNGVPFGTNLNTAAKINAGVDIINTLANYYKIQAPIFIDNRESVNNLIDSNSQIINLVVSEDEKLNIKNN